MTICYREVGGKLERRILASGERHSRREERPHEHMSERILRTLYDLECQHKFSSKYSKNTLKRVHETAIERWQTTGEDY